MNPSSPGAGDPKGEPGARQARWLGRPLRRLPRCRSTNDEALAWAREGAPHGALVIADAQSRGRGRLGRSWHSPVGENLYYSVILRPPLPPARLAPLTLSAGVALWEAVAEQGLHPSLKWPNDLLLDGRKCAGILTELATRAGEVDCAVVGIGVNLGTREFPAELSGRATSLTLALGRAVDREAFTEALSACLELWYERFIDEGPASIVAAWKARSRFLGGAVEVSTGAEAKLRGVAEDLDEDGALLLRLPDGARVRVIAGEVEPLP